MNTPRILVLSASVGAGHLRAAQAVQLALEESAPDAIVKNVDVLTLTNALFRRAYGKTYLDIVNRAPHLLGFVYDYLDRPRKSNSTRDKLRLLVQKIQLGDFIDLLESQPWDVIVNTHFLPTEIIASLKKKRKLNIPQITVTTDFDTHRLWVHQPCEYYTTATAEGAQYLKHWGCDASLIRVTGIPIHPIFSRKADRSRCLRNHDLQGDRPIVLQLAGGFGVGPIEEIYQQILAIEQPLEIVAVTGKNEEVKAKLAALKSPKQHRTKVIGFTTQIDELMAIADVVVSKPGGLTTSEVLARGAAMAIVNPIPGQESRNSDYLLENGAAIKINNLATLSYKLGELLGDAKRLKAIQDNARRISKPQAAFEVAKLAMEINN
jgi:processive 1,2-diacylglycerol beta-glucosyltransferase